MSVDSLSVTQKKIDSVLISEIEIDFAVRRIADEIDEYATEKGKKLVLLGILKGGAVFMGDLIKRIKSPIDIDYIKVKSSSEDDLDIVLDTTSEDLSGADIILVSDIMGSCRTLSRLVCYLENNGASSVKTCTLLDKPSKRNVSFAPDFVGFEIPDVFVVGYGLDFDGQYRALSYIGVLKK